jgi:hydroxymethylpyrimidine/phosphomethylpyrimidine kinase
VITPNLREASVLVGRELTSVDDCRAAAAELAATGARWVVIKGGHLDGPAVDVVHHDGETIELRADRIATDNVHGTGCSFASATAAWLARQQSPLDALHHAKDFVNRAVAGGARWRLGAGHGPIDHFGWEVPP